MLIESATKIFLLYNLIVGGGGGWGGFEHRCFHGKQQMVLIELQNSWQSQLYVNTLWTNMEQDYAIPTFDCHRLLWRKHGTLSLLSVVSFIGYMYQTCGASLNKEGIETFAEMISRVLVNLLDLESNAILLQFPYTY